MTPFRMYDCLVPRLKDLLPFAEIADGKTESRYFTDYGKQVIFQRMKMEKEFTKIAHLEGRIRLLDARNERVLKEFEVLDWYLRFTLDGWNPRQILQGYHDAVSDKEKLEK